jgi:hypothetical protein
MAIDSSFDDPRGVQTDFNGHEAVDPRGYRVHQKPHQRSLDDVAKASYESDTPDNGNRRRHSDADSNGSLSNDLTDGRGGQGWKGW